MRHAGGTNKYWSQEAKLAIVKEAIANHEVRATARKDSISSGMLSTWIHKYLELGEEGLINEIKAGDPMTKYIKKQELSALEKLEFENMKLRIELERLKRVTL